MIKIILSILLINIVLLSGCSTVGVTPEQTLYFKSLTEKQYTNVFTQSEMKTVWKRAKEFWKPYSATQRVSINKFKTYKSVKTEITYIILRTPLAGSKYRIKITTNLSNPQMTEIAMKNSAVFNEYINTGTFKYPELFMY